VKALIQRVKEAEVEVEGEVWEKIKKGMVVLLGISRHDTPEKAQMLADKTVNLRIFEDTKGSLNLSVREIKGEVLVVSQFTLYGDCRKGRRPNFLEAASSNIAKPLYHRFIEALLKYNLKIAQGVFGAKMLVKIFNDGPVTFLLEV
jgi:D-tyrosyl-tRNA(Tyr) deacylase